MTLRCLGSSSSGNCYLLTSTTGETLVVEIGVPLRELLKAVEWDTRKIVGCLVTHKHNDHGAFADDAMRKGIDIYSHDEFIATLGRFKSLCAHELAEKQWRKIGQYRVFPLSVRHADNNGEPCKCWAYIIEHQEMGRLLFATDTMVFPYRLPNINHIMIEANYEDSVLRWNIENGIEDAGKRNRLMLSHMELGTTIATLCKMNLSVASEVVLIHLSSHNSDRKQFTDSVASTTGLPCYVAERGFELQLNKEPY